MSVRGHVKGRRETTPDAKLSDRELAAEDRAARAKIARARELHMADRRDGAGSAPHALVAPDTFTAVLELRQIVLSDSFPHYVHAGFWAGLRSRRHGRNFVRERVDLPRDFLSTLCALSDPHAWATAILRDEFDPGLFERGDFLPPTFCTRPLGS